MAGIRTEIAALCAALVMLAGCTAQHTPRRSHTATLSPVAQVQQQVGPGGGVSLAVARRLFSVVVAALPDVQVPAGKSPVLPDGSDVFDLMLQYRNELSPAQRAVVDKATGPVARRLPLDDPCVNLQRVPGQRPARSHNTVPAWVGDAVQTIRTFYDAKLGRTLPGPVCVITGDAKDYVADATPIPGENADGTFSYSAGYAGCRIRLMPDWFTETDRDQRWVLAHETFHCFERSFDDKPFQYFAPGWINEGQASWAADQWAQAAGLGPSNLNAGWWNIFLRGATPLFRQSYSAEAFYSSLDQSGVDVWAALDRMLSVFVADTPCPYGDCGREDITNDDTIDASRAAFETAVGDSGVGDVLLARSALDPSLGRDSWDVDDPAFPSASSPHRVEQDTLGVDDEVSLDQGGPLTEIDTVQLTAPVVELDAAGWDGVVELPDGSTRALSDLGDVLFCTSDDCPTDCPDFPAPPVIAGDSLTLAATTITQLTTGTDPGHLVPVLHGYDACPAPPKSPPTPPTQPTPPPGGAPVGAPVGGTGTGTYDPPCAQGDGDCAGSWGDPHLVTYDDVPYDFNGAGEFDATLDPAGGFEIQTREVPMQLSRQIAVNSALVMDVAGARIEIRAAAKRPTVLVNGTRWSGTGRSVGAGGRVTLEHATYFPTVVVAWPDGSKAWVTQFLDIGLNLLVAPSAARAPRLVGLLGRADHDAADDVALRNGTGLTRPLAFRAEYPAYADNWRISQAASLFTYAPGQSTRTFTHRDFPRRYTPPPASPNAARAEATCLGAGVTTQPYLDDCMTDVLLTGRPDAATASAAAQPRSTHPSPVAIRTVRVTPNGSSTAYEMTLWATDEITNCAQHAYGAVAAYFVQHPCRHATRYLWTLPFHGRTLAVSAIAVAAQNGPAEEPSEYAAQLERLENGSGTGSVDDLVRDPHQTPDFFGHRIPSAEVFTTAGEDQTVAVFDAWFLDQRGPAIDPHDREVSTLAQGLFLTPAAVVHM